MSVQTFCLGGHLRFAVEAKVIDAANTEELAVFHSAKAQVALSG